MNKCVGCGSILQSDNKNEIGYINDINKNLCERCFRIRNYGEYKVVSKTNDDYISILKDIALTNDLVVLTVDIFMINKELSNILKYLKNDILLVLTKRDVLPLLVSDEKLVRYMDDFNINLVDEVIISSNKNYGFDELYYKINKYKKSNNVYIVGYTNAGKSTMVNKLIYNYSSDNAVITTSILPSTTLNSIEIKLNDELTLIDTPGILDGNNFMNIADSKLLKKVFPNKEIKPKTFQIKSKQTIFIDNLVRIDMFQKNNLTFFVSNNLVIERTFKDNDKLKELKKHVVRVKGNEDIVISGIGFIKVTNNSVIELFVPEHVDVYTRKNLI